MSCMKKHFLLVDFDSAVKLTPAEKKKIDLWLSWASPVVESLILKKELIPKLKGVKSLRVSLLLCGETKIRKLNREYRQKDYATDVLSFPSSENLRKSLKDAEIFNGEIFVGDLAICHQKTQKQAREFKISYMDEFIHLFFHGLIHLVGYDHEISSKEETLMEEWEKKALDLFSKVKDKSK